MTVSVQSQLQAAEVVALARQVLGKPDVELLDWQCQRLSGGGGELAGTLGIYRLSGQVQDQAGSYTWSLILKIASGSAQQADQNPQSWNYWKREVLVYQSGLVADLPGSLKAPRCYGVSAHPDDTFWMWLEDVHEPKPQWTMAEYALSARHLGEFNGAYLAGHPLPADTSWLSKGRTREWLDFGQNLLESNRQNAARSLVRQWFPGDSFERTYGVWAQHQHLLEAFEKLPVCFCHHDAFRRNLFVTQNAAGKPQTILIDWAIAGIGRVGEDAGMNFANNLLWLEVPVSQAKNLDEAIFSGYAEGLRAAGWKGDGRLARLGYCLNAVLTMGLAWPTIMLHIERTEQDKWVNNMETIYGHPLAELVAVWAETQLFLLDLADEADELIRAIG